MNVQFEIRFIYFLLALLYVAFTIHSCVPKAHAAPRRDTALLMAQSCVGEAGWYSADTRECDAIIWVYRKRAVRNQLPLRYVVRKYSAAIKPGVGKRWVRGLRRDGKRPDGWPQHLSWPVHRDRWFAVLRRVDDFMLGLVRDPLPDALHYGGKMDRGLMGGRNAGRWEWIRNSELLLRNKFYRERRNK